jgi:hypothetical protein
MKEPPITTEIFRWGEFAKENAIIFIVTEVVEETLKFVTGLFTHVPNYNVTQSDVTVGPVTIADTWNGPNAATECVQFESGSYLVNKSTKKECITANTKVSYHSGDSVAAGYVVTPTDPKLSSQDELNVGIIALHTPYLYGLNSSKYLTGTGARGKEEGGAVLALTVSQNATEYSPAVMKQLEALELGAEGFTAPNYLPEPILTMKTTPEVQHQSKLMLQGSTELKELSIHGGEQLRLNVTVPKPAEYSDVDSLPLGGFHIKYLDEYSTENSYLLFVHNDYVKDDFAAYEKPIGIDVLEGKFTCPTRTHIGEPCELQLSMPKNSISGQHDGKLIISDLFSNEVTIPIHSNYNISNNPPSFELEAGSVVGNSTLTITNTSGKEYKELKYFDLPPGAAVVGGSCITGTLPDKASCAMFLDLKKVPEGSYVMTIKGVGQDGTSATIDSFALPINVNMKF